MNDYDIYEFLSIFNLFQLWLWRRLEQIYVNRDD